MPPPPPKAKQKGEALIFIPHKYPKQVHTNTCAHTLTSPPSTATGHAAVLRPLFLVINQDKLYFPFLWSLYPPRLSWQRKKKKESKEWTPGVHTWHRSIKPPVLTFWGSHVPILFDLVEASLSVPCRKERQIGQGFGFCRNFLWRRCMYSRKGWISQINTALCLTIEFVQCIS